MRPLVKCTVSLSTQRKGANDLSFCADRGTKDQALFACCDFNLLSLRHEKWKPMTCQKEQKKKKKTTYCKCTVDIKNFSMVSDAGCPKVHQDLTSYNFIQRPKCWSHLTASSLCPNICPQTTGCMCPSQRPFAKAGQTFKDICLIGLKAFYFLSINFLRD